MPAIKNTPNIQTTANPNDALPTALMDDPVFLMNDTGVYMGQPRSTSEKHTALTVTIAVPRVR